MRLLYVTADYHGASSAISVRSRFNVKALLASGSDVEVLTVAAAGVGGDTAVQRPVVHTVGAGGVGNGGLVRRVFGEWGLGLRLAGRLWRMRRRHDAVLLTSPPFFANLICAWVCTWLGKPYVLEVRDRYPQVLFDLEVLSRGGLPGRVLRRMERGLYRGAAGVLVATNGLARQIRQDLSLDVAVQRNGYDADAFARFPVGRPSPSGPPRLRILVHGLFGRLFDDASFLALAVRCAEHAAPHEFVLAGYGPGLEPVRQAGLPNVRCLGQLDHAAILDLLEQVDLGLSLHTEQAGNTFPVKVFEYIGAGLPCVVMPRSEAGVEVEASGMGWTFAAGEWEACAELVARLSRHPEMLRQAAARVQAERFRYSRQYQSGALVEAVARIRPPIADRERSA